MIIKCKYGKIVKFVCQCKTGFSVMHQVVEYALEKAAKCLTNRVNFLSVYLHNNPHVKKKCLFLRIDNSTINNLVCFHSKWGPLFICL